MKAALEQVASGHDLSGEEAERAFTQMLDGNASAAEISAFLLALKAKGETIAEIAAAARIIRSRMQIVPAPADAMDVCGTGGDGRGTYNISTAVAFVVAACGVTVAKHGNRAVSSQSGSSDVLSALGINPAMGADGLQRCISQANLCFISAPDFHPALKPIGAIRRELGTRTIFNLLGPLCNPAQTRYQLMGIYDAALVEAIATVQQQLGAESVWVVHGADGLDELSITGNSAVAMLADGKVTVKTISPHDANLPTHAIEDIIGSDAKANAAALRAVLAGEDSAYRDAVLLNAAAALCLHGDADDMPTGAALAAEAIDSGRAAAKLAQLVELSHG